VPVVVAGSGGSIPRWKQRTKGQWLAWIATRLWRLLDASYVTLFLRLSPERLVMTTSEPWGFSHDSTPNSGQLAGLTDTAFVWASGGTQVAGVPGPTLGEGLPGAALGLLGLGWILTRRKNKRSLAF
jgi:hypothetical protein